MDTPCLYRLLFFMPKILAFMSSDILLALANGRHRQEMGRWEDRELCLSAVSLTQAVSQVFGVLELLLKAIAPVT